jgi:hypothetical protein
LIFVDYEQEISEQLARHEKKKSPKVRLQRCRHILTVPRNNTKNIEGALRLALKFSLRTLSAWSTIGIMVGRRLACKFGLLDLLVITGQRKRSQTNLQNSTIDGSKMDRKSESRNESVS